MKKRYYDIDLLRCLCIIVLPFIHVVEFWAISDMCGGFLNQQTIDWFYTPCYILTIFVAPTFMLLMGVNMSFTHHDKPKDFLIRGLKLLLLELTLNTIRYLIPGTIGAAIASSSELRKDVLNMTLYAMINSDILAFAGLAFIAFALFKKLKIKPIFIMVISIVLYVIGELVLTQFISPILQENAGFHINNFLGNFFYINGDSTFPFTEWLVFVASGYCLGEYMFKTEEKQIDKWYIGLAIVSIIALSILLPVVLNTDRDPFTVFTHNLNNGRNDYVCLICDLSICFLILTITHFLYKLFRFDKNTKLNAFVSNLSKSITIYYATQWIIVGFVMFILGGFGLWKTHQGSVLYAIFGTILISVISFIVGFLFVKRKKTLWILG